MIRLTVSYSRTEGRPNFGSEKAGAELGFDVGLATLDDAAGLVAQIRKAYALCEDAVTEQLAGCRPSIEPVKPPAPALPPAVPSNGNAPHNRLNGFPPPRTPKAFLGWLNAQSVETQAAVKAIAESKGLPSMILEWSDAAVCEVYRLAAQPPEKSHHEQRLERLAAKAKADRSESEAFARNGK